MVFTLEQVSHIQQLVKKDDSAVSARDIDLLKSLMLELEPMDVLTLDDAMFSKIALFVTTHSQGDEELLSDVSLLRLIRYS